MRTALLLIGVLTAAAPALGAAGPGAPPPPAASDPDQATLAELWRLFDDELATWKAAQASTSPASLA